MTPDLMEQGAQRYERAQEALVQGKTASGGRAAAFSRPLVRGEVDTTHGRILYLDEVSVSFDGFKAINKLSLDIAPGVGDRVVRHFVLGLAVRANQPHSNPSKPVTGSPGCFVTLNSCCSKGLSLALVQSFPPVRWKAQSPV